MTAGNALPRWLVPSVVLATLVPLVVAVIAQRDGHWYPVFDLAMTELRVRDVGGTHTPLVGLQGRIGPTGSHPGPLSFYLLAPVYRLFGASAFALQAAAVAFHAGAVVTALLVSSRRRNPRVVVGVGVLLLLLMRGYGLGPLTEPWNPHLPMLWFLAFLVAAWAVLDGDLPMLVPAVLAGSICAQTHVPYLPMTVGIGAVVGIVAFGRAWAGPESHRGDWRWLPAAIAVGVVLWIPPLVEEATHDPGNITQLIDHLGSPADAPIGVRAASRLVLEHLDAWQLVVVESAHPGTYVRVLSGPGPTRQRGAATAAVWVACVVAAMARRHRGLMVLHATVALSGLMAVVAIARIYGAAWYYLMLWAFSIGALMLLAIAATIVVVVQGVRPFAPLQRVVLPVGLVVVAALTVQLTVLAREAGTDTPDTTAQLGRLVPDTVRALERSEGASTGRDGRYHLHWDDATNGGAEGLGMVNELVRRGYRVSVDEREAVRVPSYRVARPGDATALVVVASGGWIDLWAAKPGAMMVAMDDPRTAAQRREFARVRAEAAEALQATGRGDLVERLDTDLFGVALNEGVDASLGSLLGRMLDIGVAVAVFVLPPEAAS